MKTIAFLQKEGIRFIYTYLHDNLSVCLIMISILKQTISKLKENENHCIHCPAEICKNASFRWWSKVAVRYGIMAENTKGKVGKSMFFFKYLLNIAISVRIK